MKALFHIAKRTDWRSAQESGVYCPGSLAAEGFIHCSQEDQVLRVANAIFAGQHDLVLLLINPGKITAEVRWERLTAGSESFPHIYGPLNTEAVTRAMDFQPGPDGLFVLPEY